MNDDKRYTNYNHPYQAPRQGQNGKDEYHKADAPFQFPWWAIVAGFIFNWPLGLVLIGLNMALEKGYFKELSGKANDKINQSTTQPIYSRSAPTTKYAAPQSAAKTGDAVKDKPVKTDTDKDRTAAIMAIVGAALLAVGVLSFPSALSDLVFALSEGLHLWALEDILTSLVFAGSGIGCLFGAGKLRTNRRLRKKIANIVGDAKYMYIADIAAALPCSYEKCCKYLENCIDADLFGDNAYLDMRTKCLVVSGPAPEPATPKPAPKKAAAPAAAAATPDKYQQILDDLHRVNQAIPDETMTDKIARLETVSAKIFEQAKSDPTKLPHMRKFMDYYLPTSLKLLKTYAELDAQGVEGENISESKHRIEQTMDTLVVAFENQLDQLFRGDALDVSADIDVMQNMLRADGLTGDDPFKMGRAPAAPASPHLEL